MKRSFTNYENCHSGSRLDEFVARLFNFKKNGTYVDIGSAHSMYHNNSHYLDVHLDWSGVCVELESKFNDTYQDRKHCKHINDDATKLDYKSIFAEKNFQNSIDYLSIDVDMFSFDALKALPHDSFRFKVIGIEHDHYLNGDLYRVPQREYLANLGYALVCGDVYVRHPDFVNCAFEDWYLDSSYFGTDVLNKLKSNACYPEDILTKF